MSFRPVVRIAAFLLWLATAESLFAQIITNVTPPLGGHGEFVVVKILGGGFEPVINKHPNALSVDFNGTISTTDTNAVVSDNEIDITNIPAAATNGFIHVSINHGSSVQSPQPFVIVPTNMPYATNFSPTYGASGSAVIITGVHFQTAGVNAATFNGIAAASYFKKSDNEIDVTAPAGVATGPIILQSSLGTTHYFSTATNVISTATNFFVQPSITSFSPASGRPNTNVIITGNNLTAISAVQFGSFNAQFFIISNNTTVLAVVPTNTSTATITVQPPLGTIFSPASSSSSFKMLPTIYSFSPAMGLPNTTITITGAGLNEKSPQPSVTIGGTTVASFGTVTPTSLSFSVPATAGSGVIVVTTTNGSITSSGVFYMPAVISAISPTFGGVGTIVRIVGNSFTNASAVSFNGVPATTFVVTNNTTIGAVVPAGVTTGPVSVTTPFGATNSSSLFFAAPTITSFTPIHGGAGTLVTITGASFTNASAVSFNGTPATTFVVTNDSTIGVIVPSGTTTGPISVTAPGGTGISTASFTIDSADLAVNVSDVPNPVFIGSNLVYTITVTNNGLADAGAVLLTNLLPTSVILKSVTAPGSVFSNTNNNPLTFRLGTVSANSSVIVAVTVLPQAIGLITNTATVATSATPDPNLANNVFSVTTTVWPLPFLSITNLMSNNLVQISWPAPLGNFTLQSNTNLSSSASWNSDTAARTVSGTNISVIETNLGNGKFFRLKQ